MEGSTRRARNGCTASVASTSPYGTSRGRRQRAALPAVRGQGAGTLRTLCDQWSAAGMGSAGRISGERPERSRGSHMAGGYRVFRVDTAIRPCTGRAGAHPGGGRAAAGGAAGAPGAGRWRPTTGGGRGRGGAVTTRGRAFGRSRRPAQIREGVGPDGNWMIDLHQRFDLHEAAELCRLLKSMRPFCVEDPLREEQFRTQIPKLACSPRCRWPQVKNRARPPPSAR